MRPDGGYANSLARLLRDPDPPLVSVIIRSVGRAELAVALDSVARQVYPAIEVVVVNALGPEHPALPQHCGSFPIRVCGGTRLGRSAAANVGLAEARGRFLIFLDDDDFFFPNHVARLVGSLVSCPDVRVAYGGVQSVVHGRLGGLVLDRPFDFDELVAGNYIPIHAALFARSLIDEGASFDEDLDAYEDWDFFLQLAQKTRFLHVEQVSACYRAGGASNVGLGTDRSSQQRERERILTKWSHLVTPRMVSAVFAAREGAEPAEEEPGDSRLAEALVEAAVLRRQLDEVLGSLSWMVTAPLRAVARAIRGPRPPKAEAVPAPPTRPQEAILGSPPVISAILPVFDAARTDRRYLEEAVDSVRRQTWGCSELLIVDDGSADDTEAVSRSLAEGCAELPVRVLRQENRGQSAARNLGAREARGEWLAFIDQDDRWTADHLKVMVPRVMDGSVDVVYSDADLIGGVEWRGIHRNHAMGAPHPKLSLEDIALRDCFAPPGTMLIRRELFLRVGGFDESLSGYEDDDLLLRLVGAGNVAYVPVSTLLWRQYDTSYSQTERMVTSRERYWRKLLERYAAGDRRLQARITKRFFWVFFSQAMDQLHIGNQLSTLNFAKARETVRTLSTRDRLAATTVFLPGYRLARLVPRLRRTFAATAFRLARPWIW